MKTIYKFLLPALLILGSCADSRFENMIGDSVYFPKSDLQTETITVIDEDDYVYDIWIHKAGYFQDRFAAGLSLDYAYLMTYNNTHRTEYEMLDEKYYAFNRDFVIEADVNETAVPLTLKMNSLINDLGYGTYYIPLLVTSKTPGGAVHVEKANFILALTLQQPILGIDGDKKGELSLDFSNNPVESYELDITAKLDVNAPADLEILYNVDETLLSQDEEILGADYYVFESNVTMATGEQYAENFLSLNVANMPRGKWVIPIRITTSNEKVKLDDMSYLKLTVTKGTLDDIQWSGDYFQQNEIIVPSQVVSDKLIATTQGADVEVSSDQSWVAVSTKDDGNIYMNITAVNPTGNKERTATVTVLDNGTKLTKTIKVRQCMPGYGTILNRTLWSIPVYSSNVSDKVSQFGRLYDGFWPANSTENANSFVEFNNRDDGSTPFVLTFDMGEGHRSYNSFGLMPRLQWAQPSPKRVKIEVSDDMNTWTILGPNATTTGMWDAFTELELRGGSPTGSWENHYEGIVHWFDLGTQTKRYIRLSLYESWYQATGKVVCLNQVFVSQR